VPLIHPDYCQAEETPKGYLRAAALVRNPYGGASNVNG